MNIVLKKKLEFLTWSTIDNHTQYRQVLGSYSYQYNVIVIYFQIGKFGSLPLPASRITPPHDHRAWHFILYGYLHNTIKQWTLQFTVFGVQSTRFHYCGTSTDYNNYIL